MCGIAGIVSAERLNRDLLRSLTGPIAHRGPDDEGFWIDEEAGVGLGHRRLAILDLSPLGHQPMGSKDGRWILSFNGEIFNHREMRAELDAQGLQTWRGHSDTEILVEAIARWGLADALKRAVGQFAVSAWDRKERKLYLARDRFGEKPLYYGWVGGDFLFGSELKVLRAHPGFDNGINRCALRPLAARVYIPAPLSIYQHVYKLPPGCILSVTAHPLPARPSELPVAGYRSTGMSIEPYWSYRDVVVAGLDHLIQSEDEALEQLEAVLVQAIEQQSFADVPVGAFLSGGFDSSTVVGLYQKHSNRSVQTFTIGFEEAAFNEAEWAKKVAAHFGTEHHEQYVTVEETQRVLPLLPSMYDEPFADSSQIPTHLVSRFARQNVTVALSGDGGDELFGGYNRYFGTARLWGAMRRLPQPLRSVSGKAFAKAPAEVWESFGRLLPGGRRPPYFGAKVQKAFRTMSSADCLEDVFNTFLDEWSGEDSPVLSDGSADPCSFDLDIGRPAPDAVRMMYCDAVSYLPDDILCKVDRASMAVNLEVRVPFLDHRVAAVAARIPASMKISGGKGKQIVRKLLYRHAPKELFERPKAGFGIPVGEWIKGPLRPWAEALLDERRLRDEGFFDAKRIRRRWDQHLAGTRDGSFSLWAILMFQAWLDEQRPVAADAEPRRLAG